MGMGHREPMHGGAEFDAFTGWRRVTTRVIWATFLYGVSIADLAAYFSRTLTVEQIELALRYEMRGRKRRLGT